MSEARDQLRESVRQTDAWLLDWQPEIDAVWRCAQQLNPTGGGMIKIEQDLVAPRLGAALTAVAARAWQLHQSFLNWCEVDPTLPDAINAGYQAWGGRQALQIGLAQHLGLSLVHARWLADGLTGFRLEVPPSNDETS